LLAVALYYGPTPVELAISRCEGFLTDVTGDRSVEAAVGNSLAGLRAMRGDFDEARKLWAAARKQYEELGLNFRRAARSAIAAAIETLAGDDEAAERELRWAYETLERMGEKGARASIAAVLGETLYNEGRDDEAARFTEITEELAAADDLVPQALLRSVRAKVLARRGELDQAEGLARDAVALVESTDFPDLQAGTFLSLAEVLESAGKTEEAARLTDRARELYERKGNVVAARRMVRSINTNGRQS
jgi:tetratricopeptide (TPR) repeat protein